MIIEQRWIVGTSEDCDVRVTDEYASAYHCEVARSSAGQFFVCDLGSTNGTRIRRADLTTVKAVGWTPIMPGHTLIVGRSEIPWSVAE